MKSADPLLTSRIALALLDKLPAREAGYTVLVTSALAGEGKTFVARKLGAALARTLASDVVLASTRADASGAGGDASHTSSRNGFLGVVADGQLSESSLRIDPSSQLWYLPAGATTSRDILFQSDRMAHALSLMQQRFRLTVFDGPVLADCGSLLQLVDAVVLVVDSRNTSPQAVRREMARAAVEPSRFAGAVLNHVDMQVPAWLGEN